MGEITKTRLLFNSSHHHTFHEDCSKKSRNDSETIRENNLMDGEHSSSSKCPERKRKQGHTVYRVKKKSWINDCQKENFDAKAEFRERRKARDDTVLHEITFGREDGLDIKFGHVYML